MRPARLLVVACGGAAGAAARWGVTETLGANTGGFDWTLVALTTFSTLADDLRNLWATSTAKAATYVATTLILGIGAAAAGLAAVG